MKNRKTFCIKTLGCKVNQYESEVIREGFQSRGLIEVTGDAPDVYIVNTCTVTSRSDRKSRSIIAHCARANPDALIVVTGCYAQLMREELLSLSGVGLVIGNTWKDRLAGLVMEGRGGCIGLEEPDTNSSFKIRDFAHYSRAFLKVQDGCDNFCSYCILPYVRGRPRSRDLGEALEEARRLIKKGFKELVLVGINLGKYGLDRGESDGLSTLIKEIDKIEGSFRIRLSSVEPMYITPNLIEVIASRERVCPHLHIPLQSGDDRILARMNRTYTSIDYIGLIERIRRKIPDVAITTDLIVGFPGEDEEAFSNTLQTIGQVRPSRTHIFTYSKRPHTRAASYKESVPHSIVKDRYTRLQNLTSKLQLEYHRRFLGKEVDVLIETRKDGFWTGYTDTYIRCLIK